MLWPNIKNVKDTRVGDTIYIIGQSCNQSFTGLQESQPYGVLRAIYPADGSEYGDLREALEKLH